MKKLCLYVVVMLCVSLPAFAADGPGLTELAELKAARDAVATATQALEALKKAKTLDNVAIAKAEQDLASKQAVLATVQEQVRPVLNGILNGLPVKDTPISKDKCLMARPLFGDLNFMGLDNWSVGTAVSTQLVRYNFSTKKTSVNTSVGAGISLRYYGYSPVGNAAEAKRLGFTDQDVSEMKHKEGEDYYKLPVYRISPACRATTSDFGKERKEKLAGSIFSITPTLYASKQENSQDVSVQPAILLGFLDDIINIGTGFNLSGPETGKVFLVFSLGYGFQF